MAHLKIEAPAEPASEDSLESLGWQLRAALPPLRLHCVAIFDRSAEVLWLSESVLGPDEQGFAAEALNEFEAAPATAHRHTDFLDGRGAVFLPIRVARSQLAGLVMIVVDARTLAGGNLPARIATSAVRGLLDQLAQELPAPVQAAAQASAEPRNESDATSAQPAAFDSVGEITIEILSPESVEEVLTFELGPESLPPRVAESSSGPAPHSPGPTVECAPEAPRPATCAPASRIEELAKLRPGGRLRRFQVLPQQADSPEPIGVEGTSDPCPSITGSEELLSRMTALLAWLDSSTRPLTTPVNFSFPLSPQALADEDLPRRIRDCLGRSAARAALVGLEFQESAYAQHRERIDCLLEVIESLGSFVVVDDFTFDSATLELLRSKAVRLIKVHPHLIDAALRDKLAQARIVAICQAARVLGIHCAAKQVKTQAAKRWLAAAGFDFAQGPLFDAPRWLDSLSEELA